jgi:hypothetical protein
MTTGVLRTDDGLGIAVPLSWRTTTWPVGDYRVPHHAPP